MKYTFSEHALEQIKRRNLSLSLIEEVLTNPESIVDSGNLKVFQSVVEIEQTSKYLLRVFVNLEKSSIVSCYGL
jgi:hypothetical protein